MSDGMKRRRLRPLVITMGSERQAYIMELFRQPQMRDSFEEPAFTPGVPSRSLRTRSEFFRLAYEAGLLPRAEWEAIEQAVNNPKYKLHPDWFFECLEGVPVTQGRKGSPHDLNLHFSVELWRKAKGINRGRSVLACCFAHLLAMKKCVQGGYDFILEDNVRAPPELCAERIWETIDASEELSRSSGNTCHMRYYGWLGSRPNLKWTLSTFAPREGYPIDGCRVFPFPVTADIGDPDEANVLSDDELLETTGHTKPGGTPIWGAYAYSVSKEGYKEVLKNLQSDVGALLWKGKRMRAYIAKPVDKIIPRQIMATFGRDSIHVTAQPAFFRAPMLTSKIHTQWDPEFCRSTTYQLQVGGLDWDCLWLSRNELRVVKHHKDTGQWLTIAKLEEEDGALKET